ncbi:MAG: hypothetical protein PHW13_07780 [Methylococcales bacterium]|nr:hypothetical protein [Methylococcales bacterium]
MVSPDLPVATQRRDRQNLFYRFISNGHAAASHCELYRITRTEQAVGGTIRLTPLRQTPIDNNSGTNAAPAVKITTQNKTTGTRQIEDETLAKP